MNSPRANPSAIVAHVVLAQGQSNNPVRRALEDAVAEQLAVQPGLSVVVTPHLYDFKPDGENLKRLRGVEGHLIVLAWNFGRATRWILDRYGVRGEEGVVELCDAPEDEEDLDDDLEAAEDETKRRVLDDRPTPDRKLFCLDLRVSEQVEDYVAEVRRIANELSGGLLQWIQGAPQEGALARYLEGGSNGAEGGPESRAAAGASSTKSGASSTKSGADSHNGLLPMFTSGAERLDSEGGRRWYPVIDYSRCTNCMECIDFCLFGVYGVDPSETILVEQPDNCRKGCPACSRVCPENAIIFPQHKSPEIAGAATAGASLKIDLSQLFGGSDSLDLAARERDEQLLLAGREAVGANVGIARRQPAAAETEQAAPDELDSLLDQLDDLDV